MAATKFSTISVTVKARKALDKKRGEKTWTKFLCEMAGIVDES